MMVPKFIGITDPKFNRKFAPIQNGGWKLADYFPIRAG